LETPPSPLAPRKPRDDGGPGGGSGRDLRGGNAGDDAGWAMQWRVAYGRPWGPLDYAELILCTKGTQVGPGLVTGGGGGGL
jgi:hypothetical protein